MKDLDASLDTLENARFNYLYAKAITKLRKDSIFTDNELVSIVMLYHKFVLVNGPRAKYMTVAQLTMLMELMFEIMDRELSASIVSRIAHTPGSRSSDFIPEKHIHLESFVRLLTVYFTKDLQMKMEFAFSIYDKSDSRQLNGKEVGIFVGKFFETEDEDETAELRMDMKEMLFMKFDLDKDTNIGVEEYYTVVRRQPMLLECFGRVFPPNPQMDVLALCTNVMSWFDDSPNPRIMTKSDTEKALSYQEARKTNS
ncbi:uncharacterized protein LOC108107365 [Drosophila eugracilis]|uniref:uncharacterized protein LOC108107365 n=1 Tax=Drosophila eugracilis TaxID=29029 RepID=UPI001BD94C15|nr:uncharacterized protein LOC108107365 [Drosophila eugracilis]XP_017070358.2 uncharacterized protein LOC108107365 [Drosophila eugracilis]